MPAQNWKTITVREDVYNKLQNIANQKNVSLGEIVKEIVEFFKKAGLEPIVYANGEVGIITKDGKILERLKVHE